MDYNTELQVIKTEKITLKEAKEAIDKFLENTEVEDLMEIQLTELKNNLKEDL